MAAATAWPVVAHDAVPGRVRFQLARLRRNEQLASRLSEQLLAQQGCVAVRASTVTGSVVVEFRPPLDVRGLGARIHAIATLDSRVAASGPPLPARVRRIRNAGQPAPARLPAPRAVPRASAVDRAATAQAAPAGATAQADAMAYHALSAEATCRALESADRAGLPEAEVLARRRRFGPNALRRTEERPLVSIFADQMTSLPIALLSGSAVLSLATGGIADAVVILAVVLLNAGIATATERQAERTILGLSRYTPHPVPVRRGGRRLEVAPDELVPGDVILLEPGTLLPADARLIEANDLTVNESPLTGEALPVHKDAAARLREDTALAERVTMVYRGTAVTGGAGLAVVASTGERTEIGRIQALLGTVRQPETPMQRQLGEVERELVLVNGAICAAVFALGMLRGHGWLPMMRSAISLAVAAIPEGLPAVATTTLAVGVQQMRRRDVLVRTIDAVETLGAVEIIGLDKTGTLTQNRMAVVAIELQGELLDVDSARLACDGREAGADQRWLAGRLLEVASLCSEAQLADADSAADSAADSPGSPARPEGAPTPRGSPTECALLNAALELGVDLRERRAALPVLELVPRAEGRKRMSTLHDGGNGRRLLCVKGDPAELLARCASTITSNGPVPLTDSVRRAIEQANLRMAGRALRVLGVAVREGGDARDERDLCWLGMTGLADPLRADAAPSIARLHRAGIRTVMITGDQSATALAIARELRLGEGGEIRVLEAGRIRGLSAEVLAAIASNPHVFARVSPSDKLEIVRALQTHGRIVAMTGDGINDGPALKAADVGIAMGGAGTDVAREVADIVLATDDLGGVLEAVRLGRATYANIRKVLRFLVGTNASETMLMLAAAIAGLPEPLGPMQLLWLNLITDAAPALALGLEPAEDDVLELPPHDPRAPILAPADFRRLLVEGGVIGAFGFAAFLLGGGAGARGATGAPSSAGTVVFHGATFAQLLHALACRSETHGLLEELRREPNGKLYAALAVCAGLQAAVQVLPFSRRLLGLAPVGPRELVAIAGVALGSAATNEVVGRLLRAAARPAAGTAGSDAEGSHAEGTILEKA